MKLFNNMVYAFYSDFCFIDIVSFVDGVLSSRVSAPSKTTWVAKSHQANRQRPINQLYSVERLIK